MPIHKPKLFLFDIDGTLLVAKGAGRVSTRAAMLEVFGTCGALDSHNFGGKTDWFTLVELLRDEGHDEASIGQYMAAYEESIARHLTQIISDFAVEPCRGALELVEYLHSHESSLLGLVTGNVSQTVPIKMRAAGFNMDWFPIGAYGSDAMDRNNLPAIALERAVRHYGHPITPQEVIVIGDTVADIDCARALGAVAVAVRTGFAPVEDLKAAQPDYLLDDLTQLLDAIN